MGGARVDFGTPVRDLAWSPDGRRAAFVDGRGDLVVSAPDGSGRTVVAGNPGGQTWSHPAWRVMAADPRHGFRARNDLVFAARVEGVTGLETVPATGGTPRPLDLPLRAGEGGSGGPLPQAGNTWPSAGGRYADVAYANPSTGEVYVLDDNLRATSAPVGHGSEPAVSPAGPGGEVVFVRSVGGHDHLLVSRATENGRVTRDLTPYAATDYTEPAFSPDGRTVAARTPDGVVTLPVDGSAGPVRVSDRPGLPAYRR
ncbi:hypothetical protein [Streptomyces sp. NPDC001380]|uniref:hypothetical protein n=1 Tax=Streptomyces sp. NPDC001380 TaxID=3364566 RepID=UPI00367D11ED